MRMGVRMMVDMMKPTRRLLILATDADEITLIPTGYAGVNLDDVMPKLFAAFSSVPGLDVRAASLHPDTIQQIILRNLDIDSAEIDSFDVTWARKAAEAAAPGMSITAVEAVLS